MFSDDSSLAETRRPMTRSFARKQMNNNEANTYNKVIIDEKPSNIIDLLNRSQISGKTPRNFINVSCIFDSSWIDSIVYLTDFQATEQNHWLA